MAGIEYKFSRYNYNMQLNGIDTIFVFNRNDHRESADKMFLTISPEEFNEANNISNKYLAAYSEISGNFYNLTVNFSSRFENYSYNNTSYYSPRINLSYAVGSSIAINGAAGIFYQSPELFYLAMDKQNINLKNEKAFHLILGTSIYLNENLKFAAEAYYKKLEDLITWKNRTELKFRNDGTGYVRGIDFALVRRYTDKFFGQLSYSYCSSIRNDNDGTGEYVYGFNKTHMFSIMAGCQLNNNLSITAKWYISSGYPADEFIIHSNVLSDLQKLRYSKEIVKKGGRFLPANHSLNIRTDYRAQFSFFAIDLYLDILNVYSAQNITREEFLPQTGLNNTESLGFMPTFGFKLEF
ncbi:MAG: hypothetical protein C0412_21455 [Flavobacterium sp.]|nr:hypothetical protein [Flavobacterium sp.]